MDKPSLLPPNAAKLERDLEQLSHRLDGVADPVGTLWDAQACPAHLLPYLAWGFSVEVWDTHWPEHNRRQALVNAVQVHRTKGTLGSVKRALATLGFETEIREWFDTESAPHSFQVTAHSADIFSAGYAIDRALFKAIERLLNTVKPVRAHFSVEIRETFSDDLATRSGLRASNHHRAKQTPSVPTHAHAPPLYVRSTMRARITSHTTHVFKMKENAHV